MAARYEQRDDQFIKTDDEGEGAQPVLSSGQRLPFFRVLQVNLGDGKPLVGDGLASQGPAHRAVDLVGRRLDRVDVSGMHSTDLLVTAVDHVSPPQASQTSL